MEDYTQAEMEPINARSRAIKRSLANLRQIDEVEKEEEQESPYASKLEKDCCGKDLFASTNYV